MRKLEFLDILKKKLSGVLSSYDVEDNIRYYDDYITNQVGQGKTEEEVIEEIGSPLLVAKTIIDTNGGSGSGSQSSRQRNVNTSYNEQYTEHDNTNTNAEGFHVNYDDRGWDVRYGKTKLNTWYWKLLAVVIVIAVALIIFSIVGSIISLLLPLILPVIIILIVISIFSSGRR